MKHRLLVYVCLVHCGVALGRTYSITEFGARGDGKTLNTEAIQAAIDHCQAAGGGRVLVAGGAYVTGTLFLKDHVDLHVAQGGTLLGSTDIRHYAEDVHKNMTFSNLVMTNVPRPVFMTFCQQRACCDAPAEVAPMQALRQMQFSNIVIDNRMCDQHSALVITGMPGHPIEDIRFSHIQLITGGGGTAAEGARRTLPEYTLETLKGWWPEYTLLAGAVPSHGVYARHVRGLTLHGISIQPARPDARPAIVCDDIADLEISAVQMQGQSQASAMIRLQNVRDAFIHASRVVGSCRAFVETEGERSHAIHVAQNNHHTRN